MPADPQPKDKSDDHNAEREAYLARGARIHAFIRREKAQAAHQMALLAEHEARLALDAASRHADETRAALAAARRAEARLLAEVAS